MLVSVLVFLLSLLYCSSSSIANQDLIDTTDPNNYVEHNICDDCYVQVPLPFAFPFYDRTFEHSVMFSNGVVGFYDTEFGTSRYNGSIVNRFCCNGYDLGDTYTGTIRSAWSYAIFPLWTDLIDYGNGRFLTQGTENYQRYVWENLSEYARRNNLNTVGVEIRPDGSFSLYQWEIDLELHSYTIGSTGDLTDGVIRIPGLDTSGTPPYGSAATDYYNANIMDYSNQDTATQEAIVRAIANTGAMCLVDPLWDTSCTGYATAYAEYIFNASCVADGLYDPGCPNYDDAIDDFIETQCATNPLYSPTCSGYAEAIADRDNPDAVDDDGVLTPDEIAEDLMEEFENLDPLDDFIDDGSFSISDVLDTEDDIIVFAIPEDDFQSDFFVETLPEMPEIDEMPEMIELPDLDIFDELPSIDDTMIMELPEELVEEFSEMLETMPELETEVIEEPVVENIEVETENTVEEPTTNEEPIEETTEEMPEEMPEEETTEETVEEETVEEEPTTEEEPTANEEPVEETVEESVETEVVEKEETKEEKQKKKEKSKKKKMKEIIAKKVAELTVKQAEAASYEEQANIQNYITALLAFNADFGKYRIFLADAIGYPAADLYIQQQNVATNPSALRIGLANEILHNKMVDMQYENIKD